ncbi:MAG: helix-turn-helix domain-containing protein [Candidatus Cryptobacteroides sp.]
MNTRLKQFMAAENITQSQLADSLNVVRASVSHILSGRNNPSYEFIKALMTRYPRLNMEWLMFGKGKMYKDAESLSPSTPSLMSETSSVLFSDEEAEPVDESLQPENTVANTEGRIDMNTLYNITQKTINQRKVVKVTILFDDGTYQEL